eukprot:TRINITY_DN11136_c0_g1_i1.p1 TRINITY_DN11136_c0_g1~~TRINITY_DN11136_c0_g1_i1.p1  ORF type:complete len:203 (-),score=58.38 TRINITY_DN11136_c0_g1_i1:106-714(-)
MFCWLMFFFFFQAEDGIRDVERSRGLGDVYKRQYQRRVHGIYKMPAYSIAGRYKKREPDFVPPPSSYEQNHGTISDDVISFKTAGERNKYLKEQRELWKEEHKKRMEELRKKAEDNEDDDIPRGGETLTYPMTESRTRTENFAAKNAQEQKIQEHPRSIKRYKKLVPPGPGSYDLPSSFNSCLLYTSPSPRDLSTSRMPSSA